MAAAKTLQRGEMSNRIREGLKALGPDCTRPQMQSWMKKNYGTEEFNDSSFYTFRTAYQAEVALKPAAKPEPVKPAPKPAETPEAPKPRTRLPKQPAPIKTPEVADKLPEAITNTDTVVVSPAAAVVQEAPKTPKIEEDRKVEKTEAKPANRNGLHDRQAAPVVEAAPVAAPDDELITADDVVNVMPQLRAILAKLGNRKGVAKKLIEAL